MLAIPLIPQLVLLYRMLDSNAGQNTLPDMTETGRVWCLAVLPIMSDHLYEIRCCHRHEAGAEGWHACGTT